ncbi:PaaI family thioesterase [Halocatena pleomorpha]|uniref:PaaI family thioesterase n=1 Tax=Halocatena pleomorpha TaxID=1785090 RepID=A0A3P3R8V4_9EURY|nr:PaaI family thioesterase [Halocatena pleomorpha]RRJ28973.1 PaaI family thioesterase [Halocatena pleomorpha]
MSEDFPDDAVALVQQFIDQNHGYLSWLGVTVDDFTFDGMTLTIPFDEKLTNPTDPPTMHGGIAATLVDTAGGVALRPHLENPLGGEVATINLNVNYLRRAAGDLTARAEVVRAGNSVGISRVTVESETQDGDIQPVAVGQGAYRLFQE